MSRYASRTGFNELFDAAHDEGDDRLTATGKMASSSTTGVVLDDVHSIAINSGEDAQRRKIASERSPLTRG